MNATELWGIVSAAPPALLKELEMTIADWTRGATVLELAELVANAKGERTGTEPVVKPKRPRKPKASPSTVLAQVRRESSAESREAVGATATEDVMRSIQEHVGPVDAARIATETSLPITAVSRILTKLVRAGKVVKTGTRRGCRYALPAAQPELGL